MIVRLQPCCRNGCNQLPPLSPDESMTLPGSFLSALLCSSKSALQCTPTLVWGFSGKPNWCTVHSDFCLRLILSANKLRPISWFERALMCAQRKRKNEMPRQKYAESVMYSICNSKALRRATCKTTSKLRASYSSVWK